jgi:squalene-hopene/tetraprenyl-beta-curcumene cyclase
VEKVGQAKMQKRSAYILVMALCAGSTVIWTAMRAISASAHAPRSPEEWNPQSAALYLDGREVWWQKWPPAQMDHGTVCISCHTVVPYALVRPALRKKLSEEEMTGPEQTMLASIKKRVAEWSEMTPFYADAVDGSGKTAESHSTEAVLNAVILSSYDRAQGHLSPTTLQAYNEAWALQEKTGADAGGWKWQNFHLAPWESSESGYQGAALMAVALGEAPENYASQTQVRDHLELLKQYLRRQYDAQPLMSKLYVLWASARIPGLLTEAERSDLIGKVAGVQLSDGGWALTSLDEQSRKHALVDEWKRLSNTGEGDGCATGLAVLAMEVSGAEQHEEAIRRGVEWLKQHQTKDGSWWATSLNGQRDANSDIGRFMSDAATGYAALALEDAEREISVSK